MSYPMQSVKDFLTKNYFSYCLYAFLLVGLIPLTILSKPFLNLLVNEHIASDSLDPFFIAYSQVFEGWCVVIIALILIFVSKKKLLMFVRRSSGCPRHPPAASKRRRTPARVGT